MFSRSISVVPWIMSLIPGHQKHLMWLIIFLCFFDFRSTLSLMCLLLHRLCLSHFSDISSLSFSPLHVGEPQGSDIRPLFFFFLTLASWGPRSSLSYLHSFMGFHSLYMPSTPKLVSPARTFLLNTRAISSSLLGYLICIVKATCPKRTESPHSSAFQFGPPTTFPLIAQTKNIVIMLDSIFLTPPSHLSANPAGFSFKIHPESSSSLSYLHR